MDQLEGRFIRTFVTVLEERSISRAAEKLGYVQSTVTTQIGLLERISGKKLFDRLPRGVEPTEAGRELARFAYQFLQLGRSLEEALAQTDKPGGTLRLRTLESFCVARLPGLLPPFLQTYPDVRLELSTGFLPDIVDELLAQRIDLGIAPKDPEHDAVAFIPLVTEELVWAASPKTAERMTLRKPGDACDMIGFGPICIYQGIAESQLREAGLAPGTALTFPSTELIKQMLQLHMGAALLPRINMEDELRRGVLVEVPVGPGPGITLTHGLTFLKSRELRASARAFAAHAEQHFASGRSVD